MSDRIRADPAYVPQTVAQEMLDLLDAAGLNQEGRPNTLLAMVRGVIHQRDEALSEVDRLRRDVREWRRVAAEQARLHDEAVEEVEALRADYAQLSRGVGDLSPPLRHYMSQLIRLHRMIEDGKGESREADDLRDLMDESGGELTSHEYDIARHARLEDWDPGC